MKPIAKPQTGKKTFRISNECIKKIADIQKNLHITVKEVLTSSVKNCEVLTSKIFKIVMDKQQDTSDIGFIVNSHIGGSEQFRQDYFSVKSGARPVVGKTFVIAPETEKALETLQKNFDLNQSKALELTICTYHRMLHLEEQKNATKRLPINKVISKKMEKFLKDVEATESDLLREFHALTLAKASPYFSKKYSEILASRQKFGIYTEINEELIELEVFELYNNEKALQNGLDMLEKAILNFMVIRNIANDILQDCKANQKSIEESIIDGEDLISVLSKQGGDE